MESLTMTYSKRTLQINARDLNVPYYIRIWDFALCFYRKYHADIDIVLIPDGGGWQFLKSRRRQDEIGFPRHGPDNNGTAHQFAQPHCYDLIYEMIM